MSEANPAAVKRYLTTRQIDPAIVEWKYFDSRFNRGRERGIVWVRENQVAGFLGLIPFFIEKVGVRAECAWSCDWSVDPAQAGGMGLLLVKRARELYDGIFNIGGNENTQRIFPRLADRTVLGAAVNLVLPVRLGSVFALLPRGIIRRSLSRRRLLRQIPLCWASDQGKSDVSIEPGLSPSVLSALNHASPLTDWHPLYDAEYVEWQLGRCPAIRCWSCWISSDFQRRTAALLWRSRSSHGYWRFVFCGEFDVEKIGTLAGAIGSFVYAQGGIALFAVSSHLEGDLITLLVRKGFLRRRSRLPFYAVRGRKPDLPVDEFGALNFLDADLAYRFESDPACEE